MWLLDSLAMTETQPLGMLHSGATKVGKVGDFAASKVVNSAASTSSYLDAEAWGFPCDPLPHAYESVVRGDPTQLSPSGFQQWWAGPDRGSGILFSQGMKRRRTF
jgi:hypothetical protein